MSRMFGSKAADAAGHEDQSPLLSELAPEVEAVAERLAALPLPRLAAEIMTNAFKPKYEPGYRLVELATVGDTFLPPHRQFTGAIYKQPPPSAAEYRIRDILREAAQVLEHAGLLIPKHYESNGNWTVLGWGTTRLGGRRSSTGRSSVALRRRRLGLSRLALFAG
jgi:hypothetical protein